MNDYYQFRKYEDKSRWASYWHQIDEVLKLEPQSILEIGIGNATVYNSLKNHGIDIKTLDIDKNLNPDMVGSVDEMPFDDNSFDVILCAEVLEHLEFEKFEKCLMELKRVSKRNIVLSLPHFGPPVKFAFKIPFIKEVKFSFKIPYHPVNKSKVHYWEIGKKGYPLGKIKRIISKYFKIERSYVPWENQYHHFFILSTSDFKN